MITYNQHIAATVDVETTGLIYGYHEIVQLAVLPLDENLEPMDVSPFNMMIRPNYPERASKRAMQINGLNMDDLMKCPTQEQVADIFMEWVESLNLPFGKRIIPVCHNAVFDVPMMKIWLGVEAYDKIFARRGRDTMQIALGINDQHAWKCRPIPFANTSLEALCNKFGIDNAGAHDALIDVIRTAKVYRELCRYE